MIYTKPQTKVQRMNFERSFCASTTATGANTNQQFLFDEVEDIL